MYLRVTRRFGPLTNQIKMIKFKMIIYNPLKYKTDRRPKPVKASQDENLKVTIRKTKTPNAYKDT